jgi:tetratricopeptide (TPR) repeat protein
VLGMNNKENILEFIGKQSYKEAIEGIDKALTTEPNRAYYFYLKGYCFSRLGNYFRTISLCKQALEGGVQADECYLLIGQSYEYMDWFKDAESNFLQGLTINPNNSEIKAAYAYLLLKSGYTYDAYDLITEAIKSDPKNCIVNHYAIYFYLNKESSNFAKYDLIKNFVENSSNELLRHIKAGKLNIKKQRYKAAMDNFEKAYLLDSENEAVTDILDDLRLKIKPVYKPLLIIDIVGGWTNWGQVLVSLAFLTSFSLSIEKDSLFYLVFIVAFIFWVLIGAYKFILDSFYWNFYEWE